MVIVSVIIPVYNVTPYLKNCLDSILASDYSGFEILLIDDGSTDDSGIICDEYAKLDNRIRVFHTENRGVCAARNLGLDNASGDCVLLVDGDDMIRPDLIGDMIRTIDENDLDCVIFGYSMIPEDATSDSIPETPAPQIIETMDASSAVREALVGKKYRVLSWNKLYRSSLWTDLRFPVGRSYGDDAAVTCKILGRCSKVGYTPSVYYYYRERSGSALHAGFSEKRIQLLDSYNEITSDVSKDYPHLLSEAFYAYDVRLFDLFALLKKDAAYKKNKLKVLKMIREKTFGKERDLVSAPGITSNQKILLRLFFFSVRLFWAAYSLSPTR
ncbi:MAG: glycosyltransferase [Clostridia bacterium]|nr:glycosyltransferase [Clostridia bacterium]